MIIRREFSDLSAAPPHFAQSNLPQGGKNRVIFYTAARIKESFSPFASSRGLFIYAENRFKINFFAARRQMP